MVTRKQLIKALGIGEGRGASVTLQETIASQVIPLIRQRNFLRQIAESCGQSIDMTKPLLTVPRLREARGAFVVGEGSQIPEFQARFDGVTLQPQKIVSLLPISSEVFEDSSVSSIESILKEDMTREVAQAEEIGWLTGDTSVNFGPNDPRNFFDGLLSQAANAYIYDPLLDAAQGTVYTSNLIEALYRLGIYIGDPRDCFFILPLSGGAALQRSDNFQLQSAYAFGSGAGIFSGEMGRLIGATVIQTTYFDAQPGSPFASALAMNKTAFVIGDWKKISIRIFDEVYATVDQRLIRTRERVAFQVRYEEAIVRIENLPALPISAPVLP